MKIKSLIICTLIITLFVTISGCTTTTNTTLISSLDWEDSHETYEVGWLDNDIIIENTLINNGNDRARIYLEASVFCENVEFTNTTNELIIEIGASLPIQIKIEIPDDVECSSNALKTARIDIILL